MASNQNRYQLYRGEYHDTRHGGPWDRGAADSYYGRLIRPHYFLGDTHNSIEITKDGMTEDELRSYYAGFDWNHEQGNFKEY